MLVWYSRHHVCAYHVYVITRKEEGLGTIHLGRRQIFTIFETYPLPSAVFYYYPSANLANFDLPLPLKNADVLNGWSLTAMLYVLLLYSPRKTSVDTVKVSFRRMLFESYI